MFDRIFAPALTFLMLIGGTAAIASGLFAAPPAAPDTALAQAATQAPLMLEKVVVVVKRADAERAAAAYEQRQKMPAAQAAEGRGVMLRQTRD
ncbi:MAG: hypothetical protein KF891_22720 [Rhizobacter sp.]|nr:hypothetical protein [Rhizobacter sp.]